MTPRGSSRVTSCTPAEARARREQAKAFIDVAEMVLSEPATQTDPHVAAALAVLAAIAATDAICGLQLGRDSRGQDHDKAAMLLETVDLPDHTVPTKLRRVLASRTTCTTPHISSPRPSLRHSCDKPVPSLTPPSGNDPGAVLRPMPGGGERRRGASTSSATSRLPSASTSCMNRRTQDKSVSPSDQEWLGDQGWLGGTTTEAARGVGDASARLAMAYRDIVMGACVPAKSLAHVPESVLFPSPVSSQRPVDPFNAVNVSETADPFTTPDPVAVTPNVLISRKTT